MPMMDKVTIDDPRLNAKIQLGLDIDSWVEQEIEKNYALVPDFWDELLTSERLAEFLWELGYRKVDTENEM